MEDCSTKIPATRTRRVGPNASSVSDERYENVYDYTHLDDLPLSHRTTNALLRHSRIRTAGDLVHTPNLKLKAIHGLGPKGYRDVLEFKRRWMKSVSISDCEPSEWSKASPVMLLLGNRISILESELDSLKSRHTDLMMKHHEMTTAIKEYVRSLK